MNRFEQSVAKTLEVDSISSVDDFRAVPGWCSLKAFGLLVLLENDWQTPLAITDFLKLKTVGDLEREALLAFVADLWRLPRAALSPATAYGSIPEWDSVAHLRLVMEVERRFGVAYPLERIPELTTLGAFLDHFE